MNGVNETVSRKQADLLRSSSGPFQEFAGTFEGLVLSIGEDARDMDTKLRWPVPEPVRDCVGNGQTAPKSYLVLARWV